MNKFMFKTRQLAASMLANRMHIVDKAAEVELGAITGPDVLMRNTMVFQQ